MSCISRGIKHCSQGAQPNSLRRPSVLEMMDASQACRQDLPMLRCICRAGSRVRSSVPTRLSHQWNLHSPRRGSVAHISNRRRDCLEHVQESAIRLDTTHLAQWVIHVVF